MATLILVSMSAEPAMAETFRRHKILDSISGISLHAIQAAMPEIIRSKMDIDVYRVTVIDAGASYVVLFDDPDALEGQRGSTTKMPGFEVEINKKEFRIINSHFVR